MSKIIIKNAKKVYGETVIIPDLSLTIPKGQLFTLLGPSGCGKTTLLHMIAGFNTIEGGDFFFDDVRINDKEPGRRNIGMVFQNYAIFPHMTVRQNMEFGLKQKKIPKEEMKKRIDEFLKLIQIDRHSEKKPGQLSGGQQQRVALARALVINPKVLLMDEPLSNLDAKLRVEMRHVIREIQKKVNITTIYVTHDQEEALAISDQIAVMNAGEILQTGCPKELYHRPTTEFVAVFIGRTNILEGKLVQNNGANLVFANHTLPFPALNEEPEQDVRISIRPEEFVRTPAPESGTLKATIKDSVYLGLNTEYVPVLNSGEEIQMVEESDFTETLKPGDEIYLKVNLQKINVFNAEGTKNLLGTEDKYD